MIDGKKIKVANFSHTPYFNAPAEGVPLELGIGARVQKTSNDGANRWSNMFYDRFRRLDTITGVTDGGTDRHVAVGKTALCYVSRG